MPKIAGTDYYYCYYSFVPFVFFFFHYYQHAAKNKYLNSKIWNRVLCASLYVFEGGEFLRITIKPLIFCVHCLCHVLRVIFPLRLLHVIVFVFVVAQIKRTVRRICLMDLGSLIRNGRCVVSAQCSFAQVKFDVSCSGANSNANVSEAKNRSWSRKQNVRQMKAIQRKCEKKITKRGEIGDAGRRRGIYIFFGIISTLFAVIFIPLPLQMPLTKFSQMAQAHWNLIRMR